MPVKLILLLSLLAYSIIVSQSFMYILSLKHAQVNLTAESFIEVRKLIDEGMRSRFTYVVYTALVLSLLLVIATIKTPGSLLFITSVIAFIALCIDTLLTVKGNMPINAIINGWTADNLPANWTEYRAKWFRFLEYRQVANITGFLSLLVGAVFGSK